MISTIHSLKIKDGVLQASYTFNWMRGRTLTGGTKGSVSFGYSYNADGSVKSVILDGVETEYLYGKKGRQSQATIDGLANAFYSYSKGNLSGITVD